MLNRPETPDRRVVRSKDLLRRALASLIAEKSYDAIAVKEILDRANVGRSTFYTHFADKDDLLRSGIHDMIEATGTSAQRSSETWPDRVLWFSLPIFEYHDRHRHGYRLTLGSHGHTVEHSQLQQVLSTLLVDAISAQTVTLRVNPELLADYLASTFVLVLDWWLVQREPAPPHQVDGVFKSLVLPTLVSASTAVV